VANYDLVQDENGIPLQADTVEDDVIWSSGEDYSGMYKLLVMKA
jgi:hypothetical protein